SSTVSGNTADLGGGGIENSGTLALERLSTVSGNTGRGLGGGIQNLGTLALNSSTVSGNTASQTTILGTRVPGSGGGIFAGSIRNYRSTLTLTDSSVTGNSADDYGGGIFDGFGTVTLRSSTVSGNTAGQLGGGVASLGLMTVTNSTVSGNSASARGGGVNSAGTSTFTNSTISGNVSGRVGGGLFNTGTVTLVQSLLSGNSAPVIGQEAYNAAGTVIGDSFNLFGHDGFSGVTGFTLGATDLVPYAPLPAILDPTLSDNGGPTQTHGLVFGSPALDAVPGAGCSTAIDQRGAPRPQDADGDTIPDCDIGAIERGLIPIQAEILSTTLDCRSAGCRVSVRCNLLETECRNPIDITVRRAAVR
ncbi:MAG: choice-of-anchor Q domain-containing protein, partial [Pseudonocardiaceae bacterium]